MKGKLTDRKGKPIAAGTLEQMLTYLKFMVKDGEYQLVHGDTTVSARRHQGTVYPFERWEGYLPMEQVQQLQQKSRR